uniref:U13-Hexatoxin-Hc1a_1 n=1 Tax=Hadronyche cerberea TaxID=1107879 RepID=A0A4Q8KC98_HADCE
MMNSLVLCVLFVAIASHLALGQLRLPARSPLGQQCAANANGRTFTATAARVWPCKGTCTYSDGETKNVIVADGMPCCPVGALPTGTCGAGCCKVGTMIPVC